MEEQIWLKEKTTQGNYHDRISSKDVFGFTEIQGNATYGLRCILT